MPDRFALIEDAGSRSRHHVLDTGATDTPRPVLIATGTGSELEALVDVLNLHPDDYDRALAVIDAEEPF